MRPGQISVITFASSLLASAIGFLSTLYFARVLGAEILGVYAVVISLAVWLELGGSTGIGAALTKRLSEGRSEEQFFTAALLLIGLFAVAFTFAIALASDYFNAYVDGFTETTGYGVTPFLVVLFIFLLVYKTSQSVLHGQHKVHVAALLSAARTGMRSLVQVGFVIIGFGLVGLVVGYAFGTVIMGLIGFAYASVSLGRPRKSHFTSLIGYAKFSWLGRIDRRSFNDVDILVLAIFVPPYLVGVYSVAWSIATIFMLFGKAVQSTLFPEISRVSTQEETYAAKNLIEDSVGFDGLIAIPGLFGSLVLDDRILQIYGPEFVEGTQVLWLLILAVLLHGYQLQLMNALDAIDRPDVFFRISLIFILLNVVLNVVLVWAFGWVGAAVATVIAGGLGLVVAYIAINWLVPFNPPFGRISRQILAAGTMSGVVLILQWVIETSSNPQHNVALVISLVVLGASVYFFTLLGISSQFRKPVIANLPFDLETLV